jgi:hypothetical protein
VGRTAVCIGHLRRENKKFRWKGRTLWVTVQGNIDKYIEVCNYPPYSDLLITTKEPSRRPPLAQLTKAVLATMATSRFLQEGRPSWSLQDWHTHELECGGVGCKRPLLQTLRSNVLANIISQANRWQTGLLLCQHFRSDGIYRRRYASMHCVMSAGVRQCWRMMKKDNGWYQEESDQIRLNQNRN